MLGEGKMEKPDNQNYRKCRYLAISTDISISISSTDILFLTKMQKGGFDRVLTKKGDSIESPHAKVVKIG